MVENKIIEIVRKYLTKVSEAGIRVDAGVIFGSYASNQHTTDSDIDLLVVSPDFDGDYEHKLIDLLWSIRRFVDSHIEPHAVGTNQFHDDTTSPIIGIAKKHGISIPFSTPYLVHETSPTYNSNP